jgi:hypothetical protein
MPWRRDEVREAPVSGPEPLVEEEPEPEPARAAAGPVGSPSEPAPAPAPEPELQPVARGGQWNVWELERALAYDPNPDSERAYERTAMLMFLRDYASSDGRLPADFDDLVRDAFGDLLAVSR